MNLEMIKRQRRPRMQQAIAEIENLILSRYPTATFEVVESGDPTGTYLWATIDIVDTDQVMDLVVGRLVELQVEQKLPLYFVPIPTCEWITCP